MAETLVEALERVDVGCGYDCRVAIADHAATLLPLLVAHATEAERAALLRTLLGEARRYCLFCRNDWTEECRQRGHRRWLLVDPHCAALAPSPAPLEGTNDGNV